MMHAKYTILLVLLAFFSPSITLSICAESVQPFSFTVPAVLKDLPSKDVQALYRDRDGYLWIGTRNGLFQYDGYKLTTYKSNLHHPELLTNNDVKCITEDSLHHLWIGTNMGLNRLDKRTGEIRCYTQQEVFTYAISRILVTRTGRVFIGSEQGLYEYLPDKDAFYRYDSDNTKGVFNPTTITYLIEDHRGHLWLGTWDQGLYRFDLGGNHYYHYPRMNPGNSAQILLQDSDQRIWVGTWGYGLQLLHHPYDMNRVSWTTFTHANDKNDSLSEDLIYSLAEDPSNHTLWVGTRSGLSVCSLDEINGSFANYYPDETPNSIHGSEVASIIYDGQGQMWIGMVGAGVNLINTQTPAFGLDRLYQIKHMVKSNSVRSMLLDKQGRLWLGIGSFGLGILDRRTGQFTPSMHIPEFGQCHITSTVNQLYESPRTGHIFAAVYDFGLVEIALEKPVGSQVTHYFRNTSWLKDVCVLSVDEDAQGNLWVGTRYGLYVRSHDGKPADLNQLIVGNIPLKEVSVVDIYSDPIKGDIWIATLNAGVCRITGGGGEPYQLESFNVANNRLSSDNINCLFRDSKGRLWVGTRNCGLSLYDPTVNLFLPMHLQWNLPGDDVTSILEDKEGNLWLGTNSGLTRLFVDDNLQANFRLYTTSDGLQDNIFNKSAAVVAPDGELLFGGNRGINYFYPSQLETSHRPSHVSVTDIKVFNRSWASLPIDERHQLSELAPPFTQKIVLDYLHNDLSIEFSSLDLVIPERTLYAYQLEGYDTQWKYTNAQVRQAFYNNLKPGKYTFLLRASNANGIFNGETLRIALTVLPPPWKTWWAYTIYIGIVLCLIYYAFLTVRNRIRLVNALHLREFEKQKAEELNHAKLQFFTNITHELLTPLTIITASVEELKMLAPVYAGQYRVMTNNINRLIRLLQQILEFRKAESGNLKLRVYYADLVQFVYRNVESFRPLINQKQMALEFSCQLDTLCGYFDPDKLDKIIYNLLSNAVKYNRPGETVKVHLEVLTPERVLLQVSDNGPGISAQAQKNLFKRFYEGEYRKFNTIGTGIGLSLVHDLVVLHHATIEVTSEEGKGTTFSISLPISENDYTKEERDMEAVQTAPAAPVKDKPDIQSLQPAESVEEHDADTEHPADSEKGKYTLLLVEDNEELLLLMKNLLSIDYQVYTATHGVEAKEVLAQQDISLIVSDVMMPVMDGIELCRDVKSNIDTSHIPVILLTAKNQEEDRVEAYQTGADAFISKPFSLSVLNARIDNLLKARERHGRDFKKQLVFEAKELDYTSIDEDFLQRAIDCVNSHLEDSEFDLGVFIDELHVTKSTCFRKLKSLTGQTFVTFVRNIRIKAACRLFDEKQGISISEVAYATGYSDPRSFRDSFKKEMGMLPREYLDRKQGTSETVSEVSRP